MMGGGEKADCQGRAGAESLGARVLAVRICAGMCGGYPCSQFGEGVTALSFVGSPI